MQVTGHTNQDNLFFLFKVLSRSGFKIKSISYANQKVFVISKDGTEMIRFNLEIESHDTMKGQP